MKRLLLLALVLCAAQAARARTAHQQHRPHPAVVRITALERGGASLGSGALVKVNQTYALVVTNWHVVRDANGPILVTFPDGFCSAAKLLSTDRDWDLAALAIWRPNARPIPLSAQAPQPGETLTIAGYGRQGWYRVAAGRCTQYVSPGWGQPHEMVELAASARQGDSGGPILNSRGELAGVLWGTALGRTTGSYCGRVGRFLAQVDDDFHRLPVPHTRRTETMIAQQAETEQAPVAAIGTQSLPAGNEVSPQWKAAEVEPRRPGETPAVDVSVSAATEAAATDRAEQIKTVLAAIGLLALMYHVLRLLGTAVG